ncbi:HD-GYP domain-containing protein [Symbiobacterium thermophilum]|uniref:HD-GYP domain-containing protein n=1 Tax=Symbiobacterium thermophilum TaxID=2734 RepID=UPI0035C731E3
MHDDIAGLTRAELEREVRYWRTQSLLLARDFGGVRADLSRQAAEVGLLRAQLLSYAEDLNREYQLVRERTVALERLLVATVGALANSIEARDPYTRGHTDRVARITLAFCERLGWERERLSIARMGALLHDIGKIGVPDAILRKPGRLTAEEYELMKQHTTIGAQILQGIDALVPAIPFVLCHHERWDGKGYPQGLAGEEIPIEGRILAIVDAFDAMTSVRVYRAPLTTETAVNEIRRCAGTQFDPALVPAFVRLYQDGLIHQALEEKGTRELYAI